MRVVVAGLLLLVATGAEADECLSEFTKRDMCAEATKIQRLMAPNLPMQINQNMKISTVLAFGPRVSFNVVWAQTAAEVDQRLRATGATSETLKARIVQQSSTMVCGQKVASAFVRLGGEIQYNYSSIDGILMGEAVVTDCPPAT